VHIATWVTQNDQRLRLRRRFQMASQKQQIILASGMSDFATMKISTGRACRMPADYATGYPVISGAEEVFALRR
jgi:acyl-CoA thioester hydrolase